MVEMKLEYGDITEQVKRFEDAERLWEPVVREAMGQSLHAADNAISGLIPVAFGELLEAQSREIQGGGMSLRGIVFNPKRYALPVEFGRKPGRMPPVSAIERWVQIKGIASGKDVRSIAYLIARAIGRRGTRAVKMYQRGAKQAQGQIGRIWQAALDKMAKRLGGG